MYAHSTLHDVLVQDGRDYNPGSRLVQLGTANWGNARSVNKVIKHCNGMYKYRVVTGTIEAGDQIQVVAVSSMGIHKENCLFQVHCGVSSIL